MLRVLGLLGLLLLGCGSRVVLGSECDGFSSSCQDDGPGPGKKDASGDDPSLDAGQADGDTRDGQADASEGGQDVGPDAPAPPQSPFGLDNPSLEITKGSPGIIGAGSEIGQWKVCAGTVDAIESASISDGLLGTSTTLLPSDGSDFLRFSLTAGPSGIRQDLKAPLKAGKRYAFAIDLVRTGSSFGTVKLAVRRGINSAQCSVDPLLVESNALDPRTTWSTECIAFTPSEDVTQLVLTLNPGLGAALNLYVDNMRLDPSCM